VTVEEGEDAAEADRARADRPDRHDPEQNFVGFEPVLQVHAFFFFAEIRRKNKRGA